MFGFLDVFCEECSQYQHGFSAWKQSLRGVPSTLREDGSNQSTVLKLIHSIFLNVQRVMKKHEEKLGIMNSEGERNVGLATVCYKLPLDTSDIEGLKCLDEFTAQIIRDLHLSTVSFPYVIFFPLNVRP